jgi:pimeloyl-ACP methyl ester carboxylesterase
LRIREYGSGPGVFLLHGGPGAPGYLAPVAEALSDSFHVIEPFQRGSGDEPLTVATHVDDLRDAIDAMGEERPAIVGHSWGAMLALAFAATFPERAGPIVLIGCGTFDPASRARLQGNREARMGAKERARLASVADEIEDPDERLRRAAELAIPLDSYELAECALPVERCDARAYRRRGPTCSGCKRKASIPLRSRGSLRRSS